MKFPQAREALILARDALDHLEPEWRWGTRFLDAQLLAGADDAVVISRALERPSVPALRLLAHPLGGFGGQAGIWENITGTVRNTRSEWPKWEADWNAFGDFRCLLEIHARWAWPDRREGPLPPARKALPGLLRDK